MPRSITYALPSPTNNTPVVTVRQPALRTFATIASIEKRDSTRAVGPLTVPPGAEVIDTTHMQEDEVVERIVGYARVRQAGGVGV